MTARTTRKIVRITRADLDHDNDLHKLAACTAWNALLLLDRLRLDEELEDLAVERIQDVDRETVQADDVLDMLGDFVEDVETDDDADTMTTGAEDAGAWIADEPAPVPTTAAAVPEIEASAAEIRAWAASVGIPTPARGTLPRTVRVAYAEAHAGGDA